MSATSTPTVEKASLLSCLGFVLKLEPAQLRRLDAPDEGLELVPTLSRRLGTFGVGMARVADPATFSWAGPWLARVLRTGADPAETRFAVMYGVPSGVIWDPAGDGRIDNESIVDGYLVAAGDIALALPPRPVAPTEVGHVESIWIAPAGGEPALALERARTLPGRGLEGDRHVLGTGTFASGLPGSALTLIEAEVCESFDPPLDPDQHRRNVITRGISLNDLVGHEFMIGTVRCRGMRLCEPCTVVQRYAGRPVLRPLVHRGGLRADIIDEGEISVGDELRALARDD